MIKNLVLVFMLLIGVNGFADEKEDVKKQLLSKIDAVIEVVQDKSLSKDQRNSKIVDVVTPTFDFKLMAKLSLGKKWKRLTKTDKGRFVKLYVERMKRSYSEKLDTYTDQKVEVTSVKQPKKNRMVVATNLISSSDKMDVVYKFWKPRKHIPTKDRWLVYDVEILGVSILKADKAQFSEFLKTKSIKDLMDTMINVK